MSITCKFQLSRSSNIYYNGEEIAGWITICSLKQRQIEAIILEFYGQTTVEWWELDRSKENIMHNDFSTQEVSHKTLYNGQQKHVCEVLKLDSSNSNKPLQPHVDYTYDFCFAIPRRVPATYRCPYGQTDYGLRLVVQHAKKVNKEFTKRIVVKNKLDLTQEMAYIEPCAAVCHNKFGRLNLQVPCTGYTPGQKIPYHLKLQTTQVDCRLLIQLNCLTRCRRPQGQCNECKQIKQIVDYEKHLSPDVCSYLNVPLHSQISSINDPELILNVEYTLEAILLNVNGKALLNVAMPLTIGTTPCYRLERNIAQNYMCYDNFGSSAAEINVSQSATDHSDHSHLATSVWFESIQNLPMKRKTYLRNSLRYCYKKLIKLI